MQPITSPTQKVRRYKNTVPSFGLILFFIGKEDIFYLLQERRDTFEYVECVLAMFESNERLKILPGYMTKEEKSRFLSHPFDDIFNDLLIDKTSKTYINGYAKAKKRHDEVKTDLFKSIENSKSDGELPWGFPKGRKNSLSETDQECAIRETEEECRVPRDLYRLLPFKYSEKFCGSNGVNYSTVYYLCEVKEKYVPDKMETNECIRKTTISEEVSDVKWLTYTDACALLNAQRRSILYEAQETIKKHFSIKW